ncbi:hypothetical protein BDV93DRAFT_320338 [Ceratobasidium sp. AG-I]|nr:hypothetical protein BDV93DRAFT_320338 [Ceratobasidium sp. AG-I]
MPMVCLGSHLTLIDKLPTSQFGLYPSEFRLAEQTFDSHHQWQGHLKSAEGSGRISRATDCPSKCLSRASHSLLITLIALIPCASLQLLLSRSSVRLWLLLLSLLCRETGRR